MNFKDALHDTQQTKSVSDIKYFAAVLLFTDHHLPFTKRARVAQLDRAFDFESKGRRFEPCRAHQYFREATLQAMKINYYPETDSLYIDLSYRTSVDSRDASGIVLDCGADGDLVESTLIELA